MSRNTRWMRDVVRSSERAEVQVHWRLGERQQLHPLASPSIFLFAMTHAGYQLPSVQSSEGTSDQAADR